MDRDAIERPDFPVGRRGYEPAAVDAHLRRIADELERLRAAHAAPFSTGTSEQVRVILEAAEASAEQLRADAGREAGDHVARVEEAAADMLARIDELGQELGALLAALRRSGEKLSDGLAQLQREVANVDGATADAGEPPVAGEDFAAAAEVAPAQAVATPNGDEAGARLTALNMALSGTPREETARYLAAHFALPDADALLDDVYARAGQ